MYSRNNSRYTAFSKSQHGRRPNRRVFRRLNRRPVARTIALLSLTAAIACGAAFLLQSCSAQELVSLPASNTGPSAGSNHSSGSEFSSTPVCQWQRGTMPILYQQDPQWSSHPYAGTTFSISGCGPACLAMVYVYLTGDTSQTPATLADLATSTGCASADGTAWLFMTSGARTLGLKAEELPANRDLITQHLRSGNPIIAVLGAGDFTTEGHFIVLTGISPNNQITVHDPNSVERTQQSWSLDRLMPQLRNLWVYYQ